jgi:hypothetical protein
MLTRRFGHDGRPLGTWREPISAPIVTVDPDLN